MQLPGGERGTPGADARGDSVTASGLPHERKLLTVMFADMAGSLELTAARDLEQGQALLDSIVAIMTDAVHRYDGTVVRVAGDGIVALFGAPVAQEDHAARSCYAALTLMAMIARGNAQHIERFGVDAKVRIGLHSGEVAVRPVTTDLGLEYRVDGVTVAIASRIEQLAAPGTVLLSATTAALAAGFVQVEPLDPQTIKGLRETLSLFELKASLPVQSRFEAVAARGLSRLVDREAEAALTAEMLGRAAAGEGQVVALTGEPGIGKSRLCHELARSPHCEGWLKLSTGGLLHGQTTAYLPWSSLIRSYFELGDRDDLELVRTKVGNALTKLDPELLELAAVFVPLLDAREEPPAWRALEPQQRRRLVFDALQRWVLALAQLRPVLLVVEDVQWFDSASRAFLDALVRALAGARIVLLLTSRPEFRPEWGGQENFREIRLAPLGARQSTQLLRHLMGSRPALAALHRAIVDRAQGNPLFIEEIVRSLVETGAATDRPRGGDAASVAADVPATLDAVIASRVDRLPRSAKELLQAAAAIGGSIRLDLLRAVCAAAPEHASRDLHLLRDAGMLRDSRLFPDPEVSFGHALIQAVVYRMLLRSQRVALHVRIVAALEELFRDRMAEHADQLADQAFRGELWERAVTYHLQAGSRALGRSANREAIAIADRGLASSSHLADGPGRTRAEIDLRLILFVALWTLGDVPRLLKTIEEAEALAEALGEPRRRTIVANQLTAALWMEGSHRRAQAVGERAVTLAAGQSDTALRITAGFQLGMVHHAMGQFRRSVELHLGLLPLVGGQYEHRRLGSVIYPSVGARAFLGSSLTHLGEFDEAARHLEAGRQIAEAMQHPLSQATVAHTTGDLLLRRGQPEAALRILTEAMTLCRKKEAHAMYPAVAAGLGYAQALAGEIDAATAFLEDALGKGIYRLGGKYTKFFLLHDMGRVYLLAGRLREAMEKAAEAEALTAQTEEHGHHAYALKLLGDVAARLSNDPSDAEQHYRAAIAIAERLEMRPLRADCHVGLSRLYDDRDERGGDERRAAAALYEAIGLMPLAEDCRRAPGVTRTAH